MTKHLEIQKKGNEAVRRIREQSLKNGHAFLIHDKSLPKGQTYREYPDGSISVEELNSESRKFVVIKTLNAQQAQVIRERFFSTLS